MVTRPIHVLKFFDAKGDVAYVSGAFMGDAVSFVTDFMNRCSSMLAMFPTVFGGFTVHYKGASDWFIRFHTPCSARELDRLLVAIGVELQATMLFDPGMTEQQANEWAEKMVKRILYGF